MSLTIIMFTQQGVQLITSAGNGDDKEIGIDACTQSPASVKDA